jgi:hypothetical protein
MPGYFLCLIFFGCFLNISAQFKEYHIIANDTCFYFLEGPNQDFYKYPQTDQYGNPVILDIAYPWWSRKPDAPDGTYYIYHINPIFSKKPRNDTSFYEVITYKKGRAEGLAQTIDYEGKFILSEKDYVNGKVLKSTKFERKHAGEEIGGWFCGFQVYPQHYYPFHDGEMITEINFHDSTERILETQVFLSSDSSKQLLYEEKSIPQGLGLYRKHYFLNQQHSLAQEILVDSTTLTLKRWCEDGELFYHLEEKIEPINNNTWHTLESKIIKNRFKVRAKPAYYYCE